MNQGRDMLKIEKGHVIVTTKCYILTITFITQAEMPMRSCDVYGDALRMKLHVHLPIKVFYLRKAPIYQR